MGGWIGWKAIICKMAPVIKYTLLFFVIACWQLKKIVVIAINIINQKIVIYYLFSSNTTAFPTVTTSKVSIVEQ